MTGIILGTDNGGTRGRVVARASIESRDILGAEVFPMTQHSQEQPGDFRADYDNMIAACQRLIVQFGSADGIGLGVAGQRSSDGSRLVFSGNLTHWVGKPLMDMVSNDLGCRCVLGGDGKIAANAEATFGLLAAGEFAAMDAIEWIFGTGIGGCRVVRQVDLVTGKPIGFTTIPMELGHLMLDPRSHLKCTGCRVNGHWEAMCGGKHLNPRFGYPPAVSPLLTPADWAVVADDMIAGFETLLAVQPVPLVVATGGAIAEQQWLLKQLEAHFMVNWPEPVKFRMSAFGPDAGTQGAHLLLAS